MQKNPAAAGFFMVARFCVADAAAAVFIEAIG
jgi:hypothetical protein